MSAHSKEMIAVSIINGCGCDLGPYGKLKGAKIIAFTLFVYLTGMITEFYDFSPMFFGLMTLSCYCDRFESAGMKDAENGTEGSI